MYGHGYDRYTPRTPPVKEGEEIDVRIEAVGEKGDGVAKKDGFVLFVPNVKEGDEVRIRVTKVLRKVGFAEVIGDAQGPIAQSAPSKPARSQADVDAREREELVSQAAVAESTEDFGEDDSEESASAEESDANEAYGDAPVEAEAEVETETEEPVAQDADDSALEDTQNGSDDTQNGSDETPAEEPTVEAEAEEPVAEPVAEPADDEEKKE